MLVWPRDLGDAMKYLRYLAIACAVSVSGTSLALANCGAAQPAAQTILPFSWPSFLTVSPMVTDQQERTPTVIPSYCDTTMLL